MASSADRSIRVPESALALLSTLASATRLEILIALSDGPLCVNQLSDRLDLGVTSVSQHLARLRHLTLVSCRARRQRRLYELTELVTVHRHGAAQLRVVVGGDMLELTLEVRSTVSTLIVDSPSGKRLRDPT